MEMLSKAHAKVKQAEGLDFDLFCCLCLSCRFSGLVWPHREVESGVFIL